MFFFPIMRAKFHVQHEFNMSIIRCFRINPSSVYYHRWTKAIFIFNKSLWVWDGHFYHGDNNFLETKNKSINFTPARTSWFKKKKNFFTVNVLLLYSLTCPVNSFQTVRVFCIVPIFFFFKFSIFPRILRLLLNVCRCFMISTLLH